MQREPTTIDGFDMSVEAALRDGWKTGGTWAWLRGRYDRNADGRRDTDLDGLNVAPNRLNLLLDGALTRALSGRVQVSTLFARQFRGPAARQGFDFGGYTTADASLALDTRAGLVRLGIENLLDRQYVTYFSQVETAGRADTFFAGPGRSFMLSLQRRF